jgi:hypothetical protein
MGKVKFIEKTHQYLSDKGELISVSAFMEQFKEKVDWKQKAKDKAARMTKEGIPTTQRQLLALWESKRVKGSGAGTTLHTIKENEVLNHHAPSFYGKAHAKKSCTYEGLDKFSIPIHDIQNDTVYAELIIYDFDYMLCGQSDKVIVTDGKINIWDYKTDKEITFKGYSDKWHPKPKKLLPPVSHLDDANGYIYALKMSLYMYMLWKANKGRFKPGEIVIEHIQIKRDADGIPILDKHNHPIQLSCTEIRLPYLKKEVIAMLNTRKK